MLYSARTILSHPCSHYFIVISPHPLDDTEAVKESDMLPFNPIHNDDNFPLYVTASVINNRNRILDTFIIGDSLDTTDPVTGRHYLNAPLDKDRTYYYFIRAYSEAHTRQVYLHLCGPYCIHCAVLTLASFLWYQ